jgi:hypothetical protein
LTSEESAQALAAKEKSVPSEGTDLLNAVQRKAYDSTINLMRVARKGAKPTIAETLKALQVDANALADDPVKDASGKLYITKVDTIIACGSSK